MLFKKKPVEKATLVPVEVSEYMRSFHKIMRDCGGGDWKDRAIKRAGSDPDGHILANCTRRVYLMPKKSLTPGKVYKVSRPIKNRPDEICCKLEDVATAYSLEGHVDKWPDYALAINKDDVLLFRWL